MHQLALRVLLASRFPNQVDDQHGHPRALGRKMGVALPQDRHKRGTFLKGLYAWGDTLFFF